MAYTPFGDWVNNAPPGLTAERMGTIENGIKSASEDAEEALNLINQGATGIVSVDGDVKRIYNSGTTPEDGEKPGDVVLAVAEQPGTPADLPGLVTWLDASATGARDLGSVLPDVSGNGIDLGIRDGVTPASVDRLNGLPAFRFENSAYWNPGSRTGARTLSGVFAFTGGIPASVDQTFMFTGGTLALDLGTRASTGRLFLSVEGTTLYNLPLSWSADGKAYVSFVISLGTHPYMYLDGQLVTSASPSPLSTGGDRGSLVFSRLTDGFVGVLGEFAEHEGIAVDSSQAAVLAQYYREKWRV